MTNCVNYTNSNPKPYAPPRVNVGLLGKAGVKAL